MTDKNLRIGVNFDPRGIAEARKHIQQLSKEGIGLSRSFAGISFGTQGGNAQLSKQLLANKKGLEDLGKSGQQVSRILETSLRKEIERQRKELDNLNKAIDTSVSKYQLLEKRRDAAKTPEERARLDAMVERRSAKIGDMTAARQSRAEELQKMQESGKSTNFMAMAGTATMIAQAVSQGVRAAMDMRMTGSTANMMMQAQGSAYTASLVHKGFAGDISDYIARTARTKNVTDFGTKNEFDLKNVHAQATSAAAERYTTGVGGTLSLKGGLPGLGTSGLSTGIAQTTADLQYSKERDVGTAGQTAVDAGHILKAHEIAAYQMMRSAAPARLAQAKRYGGMGALKGWWGGADGESGGIGESGAAALQAAYGNALGNSRANSNGVRGIAYNLEAMGLSADSGAGLLSALTGARGGEVAKGAEDLEKVITRAFTRGLTDPKFLDQFSNTVAQAAYTQESGARDAVAFGDIISRAIGNDPTRQKMSDVQGGIGAANALTGSAGGEYFTNVQYAGIAAMLGKKGVKQYLHPTTNALQSAKWEDLVGEGSEKVQYALEGAGVDKKDFESIIAATRNLKVESRMNVEMQRLQGSALETWGRSGGSLAKWLEQASESDKKALIANLSRSGDFASMKEAIPMLADIQGGGRAGSAIDGKTPKSLSELPKPGGDSSEAKIVRHMEVMHMKADSIAMKIDVQSLQEQQAKDITSILADTIKNDGNLIAASEAMKALNTAANEAAKALLGISEIINNKPKSAVGNVLSSTPYGVAAGRAGEVLESVGGVVTELASDSSGG